MNLKLAKNKKKWLIVGGGAALTIASAGFIALTAQYCSSVKTVKKQETEIVLLKLKINDLEQQNKQLQKEKEELTAELNSLKERLAILQTQYDRSRDAWKSTTTNYLSKISDLNNKLNTNDNRFEPSINPEENEKPELSFDEEIELFKNNVVNSKEQYSIRLNELKQQLNVLRIETNSETTQNYVDEFLKELNAKQALIENMPVNSLEDITELVNRINSSESVINKQYFNLVAELTNEIANKKDTIAEKEKQLASAFENAKALIKQILVASENQIEYLLTLRDKVSVYLNKDYSKYASEEFANNIKSSANRLIADIDNYKIDLTIALEQAKLDYQKALKSNRVEDFTSINIESFGIKNKTFLDEFDSLANKDFEMLYRCYVSLMTDYSLKTKEIADLEVLNKNNLNRIEILNAELNSANQNIVKLEQNISDKNTELKEKLVNSLIGVKSLLDSSIKALEIDTVDNSELINPLKEQSEFIDKVLSHSYEENFVKDYSNSAKNALGVISDLVFNYQENRVKPLEAEIVQLNSEISKLNITVENLNEVIESNNTFIKTQEAKINELEKQKLALNEELNNTIKELNDVNDELTSIKLANASLLANQQDELVKVNSNLEKIITVANELLIDSVDSSSKTELENLINSEFNTEIPKDISEVEQNLKTNTQLSLVFLNKFNEVIKFNYDKKVADKISELEQIGAQKNEIEQAKISLESELKTKTDQNNALSEELNDLISKQDNLLKIQQEKVKDLITKYTQIRNQAEELVKNSNASVEKDNLASKLQESVDIEKKNELSEVVSQTDIIANYNIELLELINNLIKNNYQKEVSNTNISAQEISHELEKVKASNKDLETKLADKQRELDTTKKTYDAKVSKLNSDLQSANSSTRYYSQLATQREQELQRLKSSSTDNLEEINRLNQQISSLTTEKQRLSEQNTRLNSELEQTKQQLNIVSSEKQNLELEKIKWKPKIDKLISEQNNPNKWLVGYDLLTQSRKPVLNTSSSVVSKFNKSYKTTYWNNWDGWFVDKDNGTVPFLSTGDRGLSVDITNRSDSMSDVSRIPFQKIPEEAKKVSSKILINGRIYVLNFKKVYHGEDSYWTATTPIIPDRTIKLFNIKWKTSRVVSGPNHYTHETFYDDHYATWDATIVNQRFVIAIDDYGHDLSIKTKFHIILDTRNQTGSGNPLSAITTDFSPLDGIGSVVILDLSWE